MPRLGRRASRYIAATAATIALSVGGTMLGLKVFEKATRTREAASVIRFTPRTIPAQPDRVTQPPLRRDASVAALNP
jgi:hypothetical protein